MSEIVKRIKDAEQHKRPHPFPRIDLGQGTQPRYAVWQSELNELIAKIQHLSTALENARKDAWLECQEEAANKVKALKEHAFARCKYILPTEYLKCQHERWHGYCPCDEQAAILNKAATLIRSLTPPTEKARPAGDFSELFPGQTAKAPTE